MDVESLLRDDIIRAVKRRLPASEELELDAFIYVATAKRKSPYIVRVHEQIDDSSVVGSDDDDESTLDEMASENGVSQTRKRGRGRPPKKGAARPPPQLKKSGRGRGRPRKRKSSEASDDDEDFHVTAGARKKAKKAGRPVGRPKKREISESDDDDLDYDDLDLDDNQPIVRLNKCDAPRQRKRGSKVKGVRASPRKAAAGMSYFDDDPVFQCEDCLRKFETDDQLQSHITLSHDEEENDEEAVLENGNDDVEAGEEKPDAPKIESDDDEANFADASSAAVGDDDE